MNFKSLDKDNKYLWIILLRYLMIFFKSMLQEIVICVWFDITIDFHLLYREVWIGKKKKSQTFYQSDKTMIHHVSWLQKYVIRFNLS